MVLCVLLLAPLASEATSYYVSTSGSGSTCSQASPCSLTTGLTKPVAGDTLFLRGGTYNGGIRQADQTINSGTSWSNPITITAFPGETVTLQPASAGTVVNINSSSTYQYIIISNLIIDGINVQDAVAFGGTGVHHIRMQNCEVKNAGRGAVGFGQGISLVDGQTHDMEFVSMNVHSNGTSRLDHGIYLCSRNTVIRNGFWYDNSGYGIQAFESGAANCNDGLQIYGNKIFTNVGDGGVTLNHGDNILFYDNLIFNNTNGGLASICFPGAGTLNNTQVYNNTFYGNGGASIDICAGATNTQIKNNIIQTSNVQIQNANAGTVFATNLCNNPGTGCGRVGTAVFVNAAGADFHVQATSTASLNVGTTLSAVPHDFDGVARPQGTAYDLGAYERIESSSPITVYVAPTGSDAQSCQTADITHPRQTCAGGYACLTTPGSTLYFRAGTYSNCTLDSAATFVASGTSFSAPTTLAAFGTETVTLQITPGQFGVLFFQNADHYLVMDRLILDSLNQVDSNGLVLQSGTHHIRFQHGEVKNTYYDPVFIQSANNHEILTSKVHDWTHEHGIHVTGTSDGTLIQGNEVYSGVGSGIRADGSDAPTGTITNTTIRENNVHGTTTGITDFGLVLGGSGHTGALIANNLVWGNVGGIRLSSGASGSKVYNNTVYSNSTTGVQIDSGASTVALINTISSENAGSQLINNGTSTSQSANVFVTPPFVNAGVGDFHLTASAVTVINVGTTVAEVTTDFDGTARPYPIGGSYDIGAFEFIGTPGTPTPNPPVNVRAWMTTGQFGR
jgi:hypothetical protein